MRKISTILACCFIATAMPSQAKDEAATSSTTTSETISKATDAAAPNPIANVHRHVFSGCAASPSLMRGSYVSPPDAIEPPPKPIKNPVRIPISNDMIVHPFKFPASIYDEQHYKPSTFVPDNSQLYVHGSVRQTILNGRAPGVVSTPYLPEFVGRKMH